MFCSPQNDDVSLNFRTLFDESNCWGIQSILIRSSLLLLLVLLFSCVLSYHLCCYDGNPCSKRPFARAHSHVQFWLFLSKSVLLLIFYFLPFRPWLFRTVYVFCSLFIPFLVATRLPFYKSHSNLKYVIFLSLWTATSFCYLINLLYVSNHVTQSNQGTVVLVTWTFLVVLFSIIFYRICKNSINRYYCRPSKDESSLTLTSASSNIPQHSLSIGVLPEMDESDTDWSEKQFPSRESNTITKPSIKLPPIKSDWQVELFTRFLQPKPLRSLPEDKDLAALIFDHIGDRFNEIVDVLLFKINFELFIKQNHLALVSIKSLINALDCDLNLRHRFLLYYYQFHADDLRRRTNTGTEAVDAKSSWMFQKNLREAKEHYRNCLDCLIQFWNTLTVENARITKLPFITDKLRNLKASADNIFKSLLNSFPDNREVLSVYAKYIREINMDEETAKLIEDSIEMQSSIGSEGTGSHAPSQAFSADYSVAISKGGRKKRKRKGRLSLEVGTEDQSHRHVERLSAIMFISFTLVGVVTVISFIFFSNTLDGVSNRAQQLVEGSHILAMANKIIPEVYLYSHHYFKNGSRFRAQILEDSEHIGYHARRVFMGSNSLTTPSSYICPRVNEAPLNEIHDDLVSEFLRNPSLLSYTYRTTNPPFSHTKVLNYWDTVLRYGMAAVDFVTSYEGKNLFGNKHLNYLLQNRRAINRGGPEFRRTILSAMTNVFNMSRFISFVSFFIVICCLIVIGVFGFHRIILSISVERQGVLNLFLWVPKDTCRRIVSDLQSRLKSSGAVYYEDSDNDFDPIASYHSISDAEVEVQQMEDSSVAVFLDDDDHVEQSNVVDLHDKIIFLGLSFCLFILVSIMLFIFTKYSSNQDELFAEINENFRLDVVVGDLIVMDFILTSRTFSFVATGDLLWYQSYWGFVESDRRRIMADNFFYSTRVSADVKTQLAAPQESIDILGHFQRISQSLASQVFNHTRDDVSYVHDYQYDIASEQSINNDRVQYEGYSNWYTNHTHDSSLSSSEKYLRAKETVSSSRYHNHLDSIVNVFSTLPIYLILNQQPLLTDYSLISDCYLRCLLFLQ
ncbi:hypothetical protein GEMRC1_006547 [Eukaryota sp. GEM-RC1]